VTPDLLYRIRWTNVARVAAVVLALLLMIAWPRLRGHPQPLPSAAPEPAAPPPRDVVLERDPRVPSTSAPPTGAAPPPTAVPRRHPARRRHHRPRGRTHAAAPVPPPALAAPAVPAWRPPSPSPLPEFRP
jgi:periplasmic protein TonB